MQQRPSCRCGIGGAGDQWAVWLTHQSPRYPEGLASGPIPPGLSSEATERNPSVRVVGYEARCGDWMFPVRASRTNSTLLAASEG